MVGKKNGVAAVLKEAQENFLVFGCQCHLISLAAEKGAPCLPVKFDKVLVDIFFYLEKSAERKDRLAEFEGMHNTEMYRFEVQRNRRKRKEPGGKMDATPAKKVKLSSESTGRARLTREEQILYNS
ncbi:hypothetical protein HPB50_014486 [Hyalomma asiaticum]|uniref:Uncharacterized protein n=1 Tax=Hyalomma asiaticum TaxID=266040 RepID=A0ACB7SDX4_HYAAI|nr:hypothetical protein HPB50_014486 [Hyalomma asiaticum]